MRTTRIASLIAVLLLGAATTRAAHVWSDPSGWWDAHFGYDINAPRYTGQELSLDLFGSYLNPEGDFNELFETDMRHGFWGGGAGFNYFPVRELGFGANFNISAKPDEDVDLVDQVVGNVTLRLPLGNSGVAPYLIGSGGRGMSPIYNWVYGGGVGFEYRWNPITGVFTDARFFWNDESTSYNRLVIRAGLRLVF